MQEKLYLISLGCTKNLVDSEVMLGALRDYELVQSVSEADVIIINSCGFIADAKEESLNAIFEVNEVRKRDSLLVVAGCLTQRYKEQLQSEIPEIDIFTGVGDYDKIAELIESKESKFSEDTFLIDNQERVITGSSYHAYIKIAEGCNQKCSFCAIPNFRGKLKSRNIESIVKEVKNLIKLGYFDFSFISQDSSSYLRDKNISDGLIDLIDEVEEIEGVKSARILYLYPATTSFELIDRVAKSEKFHNYFDIPIQHISDKMLKVMKRGSKESRLRDILDRMKSLQSSFIRTSIIVGHPKESEEDFQKVLNFLREFEFDRVNIFAYSDEEGTLAFDMDEKVSSELIQSRVDILSEVIDGIKEKKLNSYIQREFDAVIDGVSDEHEFLLGARDLIWAPDIDGEILINDSDGKSLKYGKIYKIKVTEVVGDKLVAKVLS